MASPPPVSPLRYEILSRLSDGHTGGVAAVAFSPHGTYLATAGLDSLTGWTFLLASLAGGGGAGTRACATVSAAGLAGAG